MSNMNLALPPRKLRVGDVSGSFTLASISEYKVDTKGYVTTWITPKGLQVLWISAYDHVGIDRVAS